LLWRQGRRFGQTQAAQQRCDEISSLAVVIPVAVPALAAAIRSWPLQHSSPGRVFSVVSEIEAHLLE
jgi:hypothetical protein